MGVVFSQENRCQQPRLKNAGLEKCKKTPTLNEACSSLEVISSTGRQHYADGGEMIIRAGDRLSQYKCN